MGLALCKDMHYAALGQAYGAARAGVMLVPAWECQLDAWMGARMDAAAWRGKRLCGAVRGARRRVDGQRCVWPGAGRARQQCQR